MSIEEILELKSKTIDDVLMTEKIEAML